MDISISFGWWLGPAVVTIALFAGWRLFGVRMQPNRGGMFPDAAGAFIEIGGYLVMTLLSLIAWLIWALVA